MTRPIDTNALNDYAGRRVTVMGLGVFGGGVGVVRFLVERGAIVTVTDLRSEDELAESLDQLAGTPPAALHLGRHRDRDFTAADLVVVNPAVKPRNRFVRLARQAGVPTTSEMRMFWRHNRGRIIGVTGSNGKSTTASLIHAVLEADRRRAWLGGNIGRSLLPVLEEIRPDDWVVLELSSFQLADLDAIRVSPHVAVVTNYSRNHIDWHGSEEAYIHAKQTILRYQGEDDFAVLWSDSFVETWETRARRCPPLAQTPSVSNLSKPPVVQDARNPAIGADAPSETPGVSRVVPPADIARRTASALGVSASAVQSAIDGFAGLPHRLEFVGEVEGRRFYNDSAATTPESTAYALSDRFEQPMVLMAGGGDKGCDLSKLTMCMSDAKAVVLFGSVAERLASRVSRRAAAKTSVDVCRTFEDAFRTAVGRSAPGDVVLLSPGCPSGSMFLNFDERGRTFTRLVREHAEHTESGPVGGIGASAAIRCESSR